MTDLRVKAFKKVVTSSNAVPVPFYCNLEFACPPCKILVGETSIGSSLEQLERMRNNERVKKQKENENNLKQK